MAKKKSDKKTKKTSAKKTKKSSARKVKKKVAKKTAPKAPKRQEEKQNESSQGENKPKSVKTYVTSMIPGPGSPLKPAFAKAVLALEQNLGMPVYLLIQDGDKLSLDHGTTAFFALSRPSLPKEKVALLIDAPGGLAKSAYQIALILREHCGGFTAVVPRYAKSAATLLALGADEIYLSKYGELGPLDAQFFDQKKEEPRSALDEVQSLERILNFSLEAVDRTMMLLLSRTSQKTDVLLPTTMKFVTDLLNPLLEKIETVHYTQMSRVLKVAEEYAVRLLQPTYPPKKAEQIARALVEDYPEHGFVIGPEEAERVGLKVKIPDSTLGQIFDRLNPHLLTQGTYLGRVVES